MASERNSRRRFLGLSAIFDFDNLIEKGAKEQGLLDAESISTDVGLPSDCTKIVHRHSLAIFHRSGIARNSAVGIKFPVLKIAEKIAVH